MQTLTIKGERFYLLDEAEYGRHVGRRAAPALPPLPAADAAGNVPAADFIKATLARRIIDGMNRRGLTQAELARRAGVPAETINRLVRMVRVPSEATLAKLDKALAGNER